MIAAVPVYPPVPARTLFEIRGMFRHLVIEARVITHILLFYRTPAPMLSCQHMLDGGRQSRDTPIS
jgi:hypothetical protein